MATRQIRVANAVAKLAATCRHRPTRKEMDRRLDEVHAYLAMYPADIVCKALASFAGSYTFPPVDQIDDECQRLAAKAKTR